jgi:hypothetical protein
MFVQIRCSNPGHGGRSRAGRRFENGQTYRMEVLDRSLSKAEADVHGNGPLDETGSLSMEIIDRAGLDRVKADPTMSVLEGGTVDSGLSQAAFDEIRTQLRFATEQLSAAKVRIAELEALITDPGKTEDEKPGGKTKK